MDRVVGDLHGQVGVVDEWPRTTHPAGLVLVVERLEVRVAEEAAVPEVMPAVEGAGRRRLRRLGGCSGQMQRGSQTGLLVRTVVPLLERRHYAGRGVELEVASATACGVVQTVAEGAEYLAVAWGGLGPWQTLLLHLRLVQPHTLVQLAAGTPRCNT